MAGTSLHQQSKQQCLLLLFSPSATKRLFLLPPLSLCLDHFTWQVYALSWAPSICICYGWIYFLTNEVLSVCILKVCAVQLASHRSQWILLTVSRLLASNVSLLFTGFCLLSKCLNYFVFNYLRQGGYVFARLFVCLFVCLSVCLCVSKITQKVMDGSFWNFEGMSGVAQTTSDSILGVIRKESWILDHFEIFVTIAFNGA